MIIMTEYKYISGFEATILMQTVRKHLAYEYVPIMGKIFGTGARDSCVAQRSIYVVLRGNVETRSHINQVINVLRHLLFPPSTFASFVTQGTRFYRFFCFYHIYFPADYLNSFKVRTFLSAINHFQIKGKG
jgi:hypothetical protein